MSAKCATAVQFSNAAVLSDSLHGASKRKAQLQLGRGAFALEGDLRLGEELRWIVEVLSRGKTVLCMSELGGIMLCRADHSALTANLEELLKKRALSQHFICVPDARSVWKYWDQSGRDDKLDIVLDTLWPGPLLITNKAVNSVPSSVLVGSSRVTLWCPATPCCRALAKYVKFPLLGCSICGDASSDRHMFGEQILDAQELLDRCGTEADFVLVCREGDVRGIPYTVLDVLSHDWRLQRQGNVSREEIERLSGRRLILSEDATRVAASEESDKTRIVLFEGSPEKVARRVRYFCESCANLQEVAFFVHSAEVKRVLADIKGYSPVLAEGTRLQAEGVYELLSPVAWDEGQRPDAEGDSLPAFQRRLQLNGAEDEGWSEDQKMAWDQAGEVLFKNISLVSRNQKVRFVAVEGVRRHGCSGSLMERLTRVAHQVIQAEKNSFYGLRPNENFRFEE